MDYLFDEWKKVLEEFQESVSKELDEIRRCKEEVRQVKAELLNGKVEGYFIRDEKRIVISAPEIVLGNVDRDGILIADAGSKVVLRAQGVNLEGVGEAGCVETRAASIRQKAVDPGIDGQENVVCGASEVVSQARSIVLESDNAGGVFSRIPTSAGSGGVRIHADGQLLLEAAISASQHKERLENEIKVLEDQKKLVEAEVKDGIKAFSATGKSIQSIYDGEDAYHDEMTLRTEVDSLMDMEEKMEGYSSSLYATYEACSRSISRLAELTRRISCLKAEMKALPDKDKFTQKSTGSSVSVVAERVDVRSIDGDGNIRDNEGAGLGVLAKDVSVESLDMTGALQKEGKVLVHAMKMELSTANASGQQYDKDGKLTKGEYPAEGDILIRSKTVSVESVDRAVKDGELQEKALTKDGAFTVRAENTDFSATETEGKAAGRIALNAKELAIRSMDVDKDKRTDKKTAAGSTALLLSEKMFLGAKKKDLKPKKVQLVTEDMGLFADNTLELQQDGKAVVQLSGGNAAVSGSKVQLFGATTVAGKTEVKDELKAPKATIDHVEAKSSFKSSNISDGFPIPGPPCTDRFSAKLEAEDAPEKK